MVGRPARSEIWREREREGGREGERGRGEREGGREGGRGGGGDECLFLVFYVISVYN